MALSRKTRSWLLIAGITIGTIILLVMTGHIRHETVTYYPVATTLPAGGAQDREGAGTPPNQDTGEQSR